MSGDASRNENEPRTSLVTESVAARLSWMVKPAASNDSTGCVSKFEGYPGYLGRRVFRGIRMNLGDPCLLELTPPVSTGGNGFPKAEMASRGVGCAHSNVDGKDNTTLPE